MRPWKAALNRSPGVQGGYITSIETFFAVWPFPFGRIYIFIWPVLRIYYICRRLSSQRNAPEDYKAREIFSGHDRHNSSAARFALLILVASRADARSSLSATKRGERERERERESKCSRNTSTYLSRAVHARMLMNASISRRESHCYVAVDAAMSKRDEVNPEGRPRQSARIGTNESRFRAFDLSNRTPLGPIEQLRIHVSRICLVIPACQIPRFAFAIFNFCKTYNYSRSRRATSVYRARHDSNRKSRGQRRVETNLMPIEQQEMELAVRNQRTMYGD